jgi:hypothetical protein
VLVDADEPEESFDGDEDGVEFGVEADPEESFPAAFSDLLSVR